MKKNTAVLCLLAILCLVGLNITGTEQSEPTKPPRASADAPRYFSVNYTAAKWEKIVPELGPDSPEITILRVDLKTGATDLLIRNPRKMHVPQHWHGANETHTILRGTMVFECDGKRDTLGPGSFNYIPRRTTHQAWLPDEGLVFITVDAPWDITWVQGPPTAADLGANPPPGPRK